MTIHQWLGIMAPGATGVSDEGIQHFLNTYLFVPANPENSKAWAGAVINYVDRNVPPEDYSHCDQVRTDLKTSNIDLDGVLLNECMATLQRPPVSPTDPSVWQQYLAQDPLTIGDFASTLQAHANLQFYLYSGEKDTFVPVAEFAEELAAIQPLANVHYTDYLDTGHDGSYEEPQTWADWLKLAN